MVFRAFDRAAGFVRPRLLHVIDEAVHVDRDGARVDAHFAGGLEVALRIDRGPDVRDRAADAAQRRAQPLRADRAVDPGPERVEQIVAAGAAVRRERDVAEDLLIAPPRERDRPPADLAPRTPEPGDEHPRRARRRYAPC